MGGSFRIASGKETLSENRGVIAPSQVEIAYATQMNLHSIKMP
jgi:hypothetical protein